MDFSPLKYFAYLVELVIQNFPGGDLTAIGDIASLKNLEIVGSVDLRDINFLKNLKNLKTVFLKNCKISDISVLPDVENLEKLHLENIEIQDLSPLQNCKKLRELAVDNCKNFDATVISPLMQLESLALTNLSLTNMDFLYGQTKLNSIRNMYNCLPEDFSDYSVFAELTSLRQIACSYEHFEGIKKVNKNKIHYTIIGGMTDEQHETWMAYHRELREGCGT